MMLHSPQFIYHHERAHFVLKPVLFSGMCFKNVNYHQGQKWSKIREYLWVLAFNIFPIYMVSKEIIVKDNIYH